MRKFRVMLASLALAFRGLFAAAAPASAAALSVNMNSACQYQYGAARSAYLAVHNVLGWRCSPGGGSINVQSWCKAVYGPSAISVWYNYNDPYSWRCRV